MTIKEKPLIDATGKLGANWMPSGAFLSGVCAVFAVSLAGAFVTIFGSYVYGAGDLRSVYFIAITGMIIGALIALLLLPFVLWKAASEPDERSVLLRFALGVITGLILIGAFVMFGTEPLHNIFFV